MTAAIDIKALANFKQAIQVSVPALRILEDSDSLLTYGRDWTRFAEPAPSLVLLPENTQQVVAIVKAAHQYRVPLVPSGGRTGLSGGAVAAHGEVVLSLEKMHRVIDFNPADRTLRCQAGMITAQIQAFAKEQGLFYPVDFASSGSSQIGGNIATNAGGIKVLKYGLTRNWISGLTVVTGTGELLELNHGLVKNATGYDLRHLLIGSEGTLGIIVEAQVQLTRAPFEPQALVLGVPDLASLMQVFERFSKNLDLSAFEFFSEAALQKVLARSTLTRPFDSVCPFYVLLEIELLSAELQTQILEQFEACVEAGWVVDGVISQSQTQFANLWALRERISESIAEDIPFKNDIAVKISDVPAFLARIDQIVAADYPDFETIWFGHIGDGNLHLNILKPARLTKAEFFEQCHQVSAKIFACVQDFHGSISAEHGVGLLKKAALGYSRSAVEIQLMQQIKQLFDPHGILNPGKIFD
jgi:FAD/FMN-containing dehydrogenase